MRAACRLWGSHSYLGRRLRRMHAARSWLSAHPSLTAPSPRFLIMNIRQYVLQPCRALSRTLNCTAVELQCSIHSSSIRYHTHGGRWSCCSAANGPLVGQVSGQSTKILRSTVGVLTCPLPFGPFEVHRTINPTSSLQRSNSGSLSRATNHEGYFVLDSTYTDIS